MRKMRRGLAIQAILTLAMRWTRVDASKLNKAFVPTIALAAALSGSDFFKRLVLTFGPVLPLMEMSSESDWPALAAMLMGSARGHLEASLTILMMLTGGEYLEEYALSKASNALVSLLEKTPGRARSASTGREMRVEDVSVNDVLLVRPGEVLPVDGLVLTEPAARVNEALLTGEPSTVVRGKGCVVYGGSVSESLFELKALKPYHESLIFLLKTQLTRALDSKSNVELSAKKLASAINPLTLCFCLLGYYKHRNFDVVLSVLMAATPCPASIGVPVAMLAGMSNATRKLGVSVKAGSALETLRKVDCVVFDKTGTLTVGELVVAAAADENVPWDLLASVESLSAHPLAKAVSSRSNVRKVVRKFESTEGGVSGVVDGLRVRVGVAEFCGVSTMCPVSDVACTTSECYFSVASSDADDASYSRFGRIEFEDSLRPQAHEAISQLKQRGIKIVLLTGDRDKARVEKFANSVGADEFEICWPHEKAVYVENLKSKHNAVCMVGDGDNDAAALAAADVGVSLNASNVSSQAADLVLTRPNLNLIPKLIDLSKRTCGIAERTVAYGTAASLVQMSLALSGKTSPLQNAIAQECVDLASILYSLQAL